MINILTCQNTMINYFYLNKNNTNIKKRKKKLKNFFLKLKLHKRIIEKNKYKEIICNKKINFFYYKKNRIKYLKRKLNAKKNNKY